MRFSTRAIGLRASLLGLAVLTFCSTADAHPLSQGAIDVRVDEHAIDVHVRVTVEEVAVTNEATATKTGARAASAIAPSAFERHAAYLASHLRIVVDGVALFGHVWRVFPPVVSNRSLNATAEYDLIYPLPAGHSPQVVVLHDDVLNDGRFAPGAGWEAIYVVDIQVSGGFSSDGFLLTPASPLQFDCNAKMSDGGGDRTNHLSMFGAYFYHGVHHILTGYDHLLFVSALVLAAATLWDLAKVVTAFTLAHTLTLTLAVLNLVHLPEHVVEPLISASIVFVAVQNTFWPGQAKGWSRLAAAFFFGLFHGLGFAGGLLDAMRGMEGVAMTLALVGFSLGVEFGHQMVVLPLFAFLKAARQTQTDITTRQPLSFHRVGSALISLAGLYCLCLALTAGS
jgi:hypothetical protein